MVSCAWSRPAASAVWIQPVDSAVAPLPYPASSSASAASCTPSGRGTTRMIASPSSSATVPGSNPSNRCATAGIDACGASTHSSYSERATGSMVSKNSVFSGAGNPCTALAR